MKEYEKMILGLEYQPNSEYLLSLRQKSNDITRKFNFESNPKKREEILKQLLGKMGKSCYITPNVFFDYGINTFLGDNVYFNANCVILDCAKVTIGNNTFIGPNCQFYTPVHPIEYNMRNTFIEWAKPITIGKNCWLGGSVVVLPNVTVGDGSVIGAGSVVVKDIPKNSVAVGNPCRVIKTITQD